MVTPERQEATALVARAGSLGGDSREAVARAGSTRRFVVAASALRPLAATALGPFAVAAAVLVLATQTLLPGVGFWDTAELQTVGPLLGVAHPTGFPAYVILAWLASIVLQPFGDPAFRLNLLSALLVSVAAGTTVLLVRTLTGRTLVAVAAGLAMGTAPEAWSIATHADVHALHLALVGGLLVLLLGWEDRVTRGTPGSDRWLVAAAVVYGVAFANHLLVVLIAPGIAIYVTLVAPGTWRRRAFVARCGLAIAVTALALYAELPIRAGPFPASLVYGHPETAVGFLSSLLGAQFTGGLDPVGQPAARWTDLATLAVHQLGWLAALVPVGFIATASRHRAYAALTGTTVLLTVWFAGSYTNAEIARYYLVPTLMALSWVAVLAAWCVDAAGRLLDRTRVRAGRLVLPAFAALALVAPSIAELPARWREVDEHDVTIAQRWLDGVFAQLAPNAVVVSWWSYSTTLWYGQYIEGLRQDVLVVDDRTRLDLNLGSPTDVIDRYLGVRPVYLIRLDNEGIDALAQEFVLDSSETATGQPLVRVVGRRTAIGIVLP